MKFALIALLGSVSAISLRPEGDDFVVIRSSIDARPIATVWDSGNPHPGFEANHDDFIGNEGLGKYDRKVPDNFDGPGSGDD